MASKVTYVCAALLVIGGIAGSLGAQSLVNQPVQNDPVTVELKDKLPADAMKLSRSQTDKLLEAILTQSDSSERKQALDDLLRKGSIDTKRRFLGGKVTLPYYPKMDPEPDAQGPTKWPRNISIVAEQTPMGGLSCKHHKTCVTVHCTHVPGIDAQWCGDTVRDCTDYSSGNC